eukprot:Colp12_sorted_trinity150504_noHs@10038
MSEYYNVGEDIFGSRSIESRKLLVATYDKTSVYYGNRISPKKANSAPSMHFEAEPDAQYTLLLTCPDANIIEPNQEVAHWLVTDITGNDVTTGKAVLPYLGPLAYKGSGFQ